MQQFPGQPPKFELKNSRQSDIALAAEAAKFVMQRAAQNAYAGLLPQVNSFNQEVNRYQSTSVADAAEASSVVNLDEYHRRNEAAQPSVVETEPQQQTILDDDPETRIAEAQDYVSKVFDDAA